MMNETECVFCNAAGSGLERSKHYQHPAGLGKRLKAGRQQTIKNISVER